MGRLFGAFACIAMLLVSVQASAGIIESGDLNIIDDPGNPSDGLRFLDMSYSVGLDLAAALANAQATYTNARLATPTEADDLFAAAGIVYDFTATASDAWDVIPTLTQVYSSGANYNDVLVDVLGFAVFASYEYTAFWTDPDGSESPTSTHDAIWIARINAYSRNVTRQPAYPGIGWLLVSEEPIAGTVPEPSSIALLGMGSFGLCGWRRRLKGSLRAA